MHELSNKVAYLKAMSVKPFNKSVLMKDLSSISVKVTSLANRYYKAQGGLTYADGLANSVHTSGNKTGQLNGKSKKYSAIFDEALLAKGQMSEDKTHCIQDVYAFPCNWN